MTELVIPRRRFLAGLVGLIAAPAVIRVAELMPIKAAPELQLHHFVTPEGCDQYGGFARDAEVWLVTERYPDGAPLRAIRYNATTQQAIMRLSQLLSAQLDALPARPWFQLGTKEAGDA